MASFTGFGVISEWFGASGKFLKVVLVPKFPPKPAESKEVLAKWLGFQFQLMVIAQVVMFVYLVYGSGGDVGTAVSGAFNCVYFIAWAFVNSWIFWYGFAERDPACCCLIQGFKYQHLIVGVYFVIGGLLGLFGAVSQILTLMTTMNTAFFIYVAYSVVYAIQVIGMIGSGVCMVKMGGKAADIKVPDAPAVGKEGA
jgi:hypothetical protein